LQSCGSGAAFEGGYESASQFNREYKRFFGQPPIRDIKALRNGKVVAITAAKDQLPGSPRGGLFSTVAYSPMRSLSSAEAVRLGGHPNQWEAERQD
jgi:AraC-like DNA-binding protein